MGSIKPLELPCVNHLPVVLFTTGQCEFSYSPIQQVEWARATSSYVHSVYKRIVVLTLHNSVIIDLRLCPWSTSHWIVSCSHYKSLPHRGIWTNSFCHLDLERTVELCTNYGGYKIKKRFKIKRLQIIRRARFNVWIVTYIPIMRTPSCPILKLILCQTKHYSV